MNRYLKTAMPDIFQAQSLKRHGLAYAETRRENENSMRGNISTQEMYGAIPLVINELNHARSGSELSYEDWVAQATSDVFALDRAIHAELGLRAIGYPQPVHGTELIDLDRHITEASLQTAYIARPAADATIVSKLGYASCIHPADCPVSNIVDPNTGNLMQIHTGYIGLEKGTIAHTLAEVEEAIDPSRSLVYVSPHAQEGYVINQVNNNLVDRFMADDFMSRFVTIHPEGIATLSLTKATKVRLLEAGFKEENIQISPDNSLTDPTLFSQSNFLIRGVNGRNGMIFGKRSI